MLPSQTTPSSLAPAFRGHFSPPIPSTAAASPPSAAPASAAAAAAAGGLEGLEREKEVERARRVKAEAQVRMLQKQLTSELARSESLRRLARGSRVDSASDAGEGALELANVESGSMGGLGVEATVQNAAMKVPLAGNETASSPEVDGVSEFAPVVIVTGSSGVDGKRQLRFDDVPGATGSDARGRDATRNKAGEAEAANTTHKAQKEGSSKQPRAEVVGSTRQENPEDEPAQGKLGKIDIKWPEASAAKQAESSAYLELLRSRVADQAGHGGARDTSVKADKSVALPALGEEMPAARAQAHSPALGLEHGKQKGWQLRAAAEAVPTGGSRVTAWRAHPDLLPDIGAMEVLEGREASSTKASASEPATATRHLPHSADSNPGVPANVSLGWRVRAAVADSDGEGGMKASGVSDGQVADIKSGESGGISVAMSFDLETKDVLGTDFKEAVVSDLVDAVSGREDKIDIISLQPGSIPYTLVVQADLREGICGSERTALNVARELERQAGADSSLLKCGRYTSKIIGVRVLAPFKAAVSSGLDRVADTKNYLLDEIEPAPLRSRAASDVFVEAPRDAIPARAVGVCLCAS